MSYETLNETEWDQVRHIWEMLDDGETDRARIQLDDLMRSRPGHPDLRIVDASIALDEGDAKRAHDALDGAERSADPALFFQLRAVAGFQLVRFEEALADAERALAVQPEMAESHELLARIHEFLGNAAKAREHALEAAELDPELCPLPLDVSDEDFDAVVEKSLVELPDEVRAHLAEIPVIVDPLPDRAVLTAENPPLAPDLLGLFVGRHLLERQHDDVPGSPGSIHLFRRNLLRACADREELEKEIRITVLHEVGHLLGLDEDDLERWGLG
jgi:predicted Zn-dependent protease with MMP-like domain